VPISRDEALAWQMRWRLVADVVDREARRSSPTERLHALCRLRAFGADAAVAPAEKDEAAVRARFQLLRSRVTERVRRAGR
jgi:hypothetical protein